MMDYLTSYGTISRQAAEALDQISMLRAKVKGKCFGPSHELQREVSNLYEKGVLNRLHLITRLVLDLGDQRPRRLASALGHLSLNLGAAADNLVAVLCLPGYRDPLKMAVAQLDHLQRCLQHFLRVTTNRNETGTFNVNNLMQDIRLTICPFRACLMPPGDGRAVDVEIVEKLDEQAPHLAGHPEGIYLALYQMAANALTAAGKGGKISLYTRYFERFKQLIVTIGDNGPGIDRQAVMKSALITETARPETIEKIRSDRSDHNNRIFDLIFLPRVSGFALSDPSHRGLGLTLAREQINAHAGKIEIHSQPGKGTIFQVSFTV